MDTLYLGVAREDITPKVGGRLFGYNPNILSTDIHDPLHLTAFAFSYGETKVLMINATICVICNSVSDELRQELSAQTGIPFENILLSSTHTHSGPSLCKDPKWFGNFAQEFYDTKFHPAVLSAATKALAQMEPVQVAFASGKSDVGINRRELTLDNWIKLGQNPWGPYNPEMFMISFKNRAGNVVANIITYSAHATAAGNNTEVTRDWPGIMTEAIDTLRGGLTAFFNGTMGYTGPRLSNGRTSGLGDVKYVHELGIIAAADAVQIYKNIKDYTDVSFSAASGFLTIPVKPRESYEAAVAGCEKANDPAADLPQYVKGYYEQLKQSYEDGYVDQEVREIPMTVIRIGHVVFAPFPFEMFTEIGFRIDNAFQDKKGITLSYTNGQMLYLPTEDQICRGGHEVNAFLYNPLQRFVNNADFHAVKSTVNLIQTLPQE